jgi:hypothetical protein
MLRPGAHLWILVILLVLPASLGEGAVFASPGDAGQAPLRKAPLRILPQRSLRFGDVLPDVGTASTPVMLKALYTGT